MFGIPNCWILRAIIFLAASYMYICIYIRAEYEEVIELYIYMYMYMYMYIYIYTNINYAWGEGAEEDRTALQASRFMKTVQNFAK